MVVKLPRPRPGMVLSIAAFLLWLLVLLALQTIASPWDKVRPRLPLAR